jgi:hypothetical protein
MRRWNYPNPNNTNNSNHNKCIDMGSIMFMFTYALVEDLVFFVCTQM